jgi:hypothetical protein
MPSAAANPVFQMSSGGTDARSLMEAARMRTPKHEPDKRSLRVDAEQLQRISELTIAHYDRSAEEYWDGTRDHDVSQNYTAFLGAMESDHPYSILDLGCGPGRDLIAGPMVGGLHYRDARI